MYNGGTALGSRRKEKANWELHQQVFQRSVNHTLTTKPINLSFKIVYYSTTLSNYSIIRIVRFVSKIKLGIVELIHI